MNAGPSCALEKGFNPLRLSIGLFIYFRAHPPPIFKGFQRSYLPKAHISRTNGRAPLSGVFNMPLLRSQHIALAFLTQTSPRPCVRVVAENLLTVNEDR